MKKLLLAITLFAFICFNLKAQIGSVKGIDISNNQGSINWTQVAGAGYVFAYAKASEGTTFTDTYYVTNTTQGENNGLYMGAYHFAHPDVNSTNAGAIAEANFFLSKAQSYIVACELPPVLDYEVSPSLSWTQQTSWIQNWMTTVQNATGITPVLYTSGSIASSLGSSLNIYPLWMADPDGVSTTPPATLGVWTTWSFKQYSWSGTVPGVSGQSDLDVFNGDMTAFTNFMGCNASPTNLSVAVTPCPQSNITLQWTGSGSGWYVDVSSDSTFSDFYNQAVSSLTSVNCPAGFNDYFTHLPLVLKPDTTYYWRVFNGSSETNGSSFVAPNCPTNLTFTIAACPQDSVTLQWAGSGSGWYVDVSSDSTFSDFYNQAVPNLSSIGCPAGFNDITSGLPLTLKPDTTYFWRVWNGSAETYGSSFVDPNCNSNGINAQNISTAINIYPNPASQIVTISSANKLGAISIYNSLGEIIFHSQSKNTTEQIDVSKFPAGIYTIEVLNNFNKIIKE